MPTRVIVADLTNLRGSNGEPLGVLNGIPQMFSSHTPTPNMNISELERS